jgi:hypothetical protein
MVDTYYLECFADADFRTFAPNASQQILELHVAVVVSEGGSIQFQFQFQVFISMNLLF